MGRYAVTIFLGAFLLFQVQPVAGKYILPWFGGGSAVWTTCMLFFQASLLAGYAYAHLLSNRLSARRQAGLHAILLLASLVLLPITPSETWKPVDAQAPVGRILALLTVNLGAPFVLVAATGPLLQRWYSWERPGVSPYRLYALSNLGSLLGLLAYPFLIEPVVGLRAQTVLWSLGYGLFAALSGWCAVALRRRAPGERGTGEGIESAASVDASAVPSRGSRLLWLALPACGSLLLLATTSRMTQDIAPIPFLWVLPLSLYLLSFVICFDNDRWYDRRVWVPAFLAGLVAVALMRFEGVQVRILVQLSVYSVALLVGCMVCHGELVRLRPAPRRLTSFYLSVATGGAVGGLLAALVAPHAFDDFVEFEIALVGAYLLLALSLLREQSGPLRRMRRWLWIPLVAGGCVLAPVMGIGWDGGGKSLLLSRRNFYGVLKVYEYGAGTRAWKRSFWHGSQPHGGQLLAPGRRSQPRTWYGPDSGIALAIEAFRRRGGETRADGATSRGNLHIGVVGLGVGTIAAYGRPGDRIRFYELDPEVVDISGRYFSYRKQSAAEVKIVVGDARISLERELAEGRPQNFDILVLDAFSSDAVPVHLLTREAADVYWRHLDPEGILAVHITAVHLDLSPVVRGLASVSGKEAVWVQNKPDPRAMITWSYWILVTSNRSFLEDPQVHSRAKHWPRRSGAPRGRSEIVWTDDYSNLLHVIK